MVYVAMFTLGSCSRKHTSYSRRGTFLASRVNLLRLLEQL